jgi:hypothetical protein
MCSVWDVVSTGTAMLWYQPALTIRAMHAPFSSRRAVQLNLWGNILLLRLAEERLVLLLGLDECLLELVGV